MKKTLDILKTGIALAFVATISFGCDANPETAAEVEAGGASEAIVAGDSSAANLNNPRPAPIGDTSVTGEQADQFGDNLSPNQNQDARELNDLERQRQGKKPLNNNQ